jgi:hypothetical protein
MSVSQVGDTHNSPQPDYTPEPGGSSPPLSDEDRCILEIGSAISREILEENDVRTIAHGRELPEGFSRRQRRRGAGILFTVTRPNGKTDWIYRPSAADRRCQRTRYIR